MQGRLIGLDALRGIAALAVFLHHLHMSAFGFSRGSAFLAVDLFFMLSGYVMARTYEARLSQDLKPFDFLKVRFWRLWPTMTVGAIIGIPIVAMTYGWQELLPALANIIFIPWFIGARAFPLNGPAWSIFFEFLANAIHAILLYRLSIRHLMLIVAIAVSQLVLWGRAYGLDVGSRPENFLTGLPRVMVSYTIGILLWRLWQDRPTIKVSQHFAILTMPTFFFATLFISGQSWAANLLFIVVLCPMMIAGGLTFDVPPFWSRVAVLAGAMSFPLYAVHGVALRLASLFGLGWAFGGVLSFLIVFCFPSVRNALGQALPKIQHRVRPS